MLCISCKKKKKGNAKLRFCKCKGWKDEQVNVTEGWPVSQNEERGSPVTEQASNGAPQPDPSQPKKNKIAPARRNVERHKRCAHVYAMASVITDPSDAKKVVVS